MTKVRSSPIEPNAPDRRSFRLGDPPERTAAKHQKYNLMRRRSPQNHLQRRQSVEIHTWQKYQNVLQPRCTRHGSRMTGACIKTNSRDNIASERNMNFPNSCPNLALVQNMIMARKKEEEKQTTKGGEKKAKKNKDGGSGGCGGCGGGGVRRGRGGGLASLTQHHQ